MERPRPAPQDEPAPRPGAPVPVVEAKRRLVIRHSLAQSFGWAWAGLTGAAVRERNMRIHLALGVLASAAAAVLPLHSAERALLLLAVALVVAGEAANSALEAVVDLVSPGWNERARVAKDAAAAAVLALACGSVVILLAIALPALAAVGDRWPALAPPAGGAAVAAIATWLLPRPTAAGRPRPLVLDGALCAAALAGLALVVRAAQGIAGAAAAALLAVVAAGGALRRRRGTDRAP